MTMKSRSKALVEDDRWKRKGGPHKRATSEPQVCPSCEGTGRIPKNGYGLCMTCEGTGEIWK
jgi:DnaJ-class molecular chaperone